MGRQVSRLDRELDRALDLDGYRAFVRELKQSEVMVKDDLPLPARGGISIELAPDATAPSLARLRLVRSGDTLVDVALTVIDLQGLGRPSCKPLPAMLEEREL